MIVCTCSQAGTVVTPTPASGEADPIAESKYRENFYAAVSTAFHYD